MIGDQTVMTPRGSTKTVRGCRCKRSKCLKRYCECFGAGLKCGDNCICEGCQNGNNDFGAAGAMPKKGKAASSKARAAPSKKPVGTSKLPHPSFQDKPQFKQAPVVLSQSSQSSGKPMNRRPPLSVQIPRPAPQPIQNSATSCQEQCTAWGMTPLGTTPVVGWDTRRASLNLCTSAGVDRENSSMLVSCAETPTEVRRELSGVQRETSWQQSPRSIFDGEGFSARSSISTRSPAMLGGPTQTDGMIHAGSPKVSDLGELLPASLSQPQVGRGPRPLAATQTNVVPQSPSVAIFSAAEGMLPSPVAVLRNQSGLSSLGIQDDLVMGRQLSGLL